MILHILADAQEEIQQAFSYLDGIGSELGLRFLDELSLQFLNISKAPLRFSYLETLPSGQPYRRALLKTFRYVIIFEIVNDEISVVAVPHASREPNYWINRLSQGN